MQKKEKQAMEGERVTDEEKHSICASFMRRGAALLVLDDASPTSIPAVTRTGCIRTHKKGDHDDGKKEQSQLFFGGCVRLVGNYNHRLFPPPPLIPFIAFSLKFLQLLKKTFHLAFTFLDATETTYFYFLIV